MMWKQPKCPLTDEWVKKLWGIYIYNGILFSHKKDEILPFVATWMELEGIMLSEIRWGRQILYDPTYMWNVKTNKQNNKKPKPSS